MAYGTIVVDDKDSRHRTKLLKNRVLLPASNPYIFSNRRTHMQAARLQFSNRWTVKLYATAAFASRIALFG